MSTDPQRMRNGLEHRPTRIIKTGATVKYTESEIADSISYLRDPTKTGIWQFEAQWQFDQGISEDVKREFITYAQGNSDSIHTRRIVSNIDKFVEAFSFVFQILLYIVEKDNSDAESRYSTYGGSDFRFMFESIDISAIEKKYKEAVSYFKKEIYWKGFDGRARTYVLTHIKNGNFVFTSGASDLTVDLYQNVQRKNIELQSTDIETLKKIQRLLSFAGKTKNEKIYSIYSPEEELLASYMTVMHKMLPYLGVSDGVYRLFKKIISDFEDENYEGSISAAGLVGEETLTQIYETLYRQPVPANMTMGGLLSKIEENIKQSRTGQSKRKPLIKNEVAIRIREKKLTDTNVQRVINSDFKLVLDLIESENKKLNIRIKSLEGTEKDSSMFPRIIRISLDGLVRFRNIVSHKNTEPIGPTESLRCAYYSLSIYLWWTTQKKLINWETSEKEIVRQFVDSALSYRST